MARDADRANVAEDGAPPAGTKEITDEIRAEKQTAANLFGLSVVFLLAITTASLNHPPHQSVLWACLGLLLFSSLNLSLLAYLLAACSEKSPATATWSRNLNGGSIIAIALCLPVWVIGELRAHGFSPPFNG